MPPKRKRLTAATKAIRLCDSHSTVAGAFLSSNQSLHLNSTAYVMNSNCKRLALHETVLEQQTAETRQTCSEMMHGK